MKTATRSATSTTRISSITTRPRNSLWSMRPPRRSRHRKAGKLRIARSRAGWPAHPRHRDPQALLVRHHLRSLPAGSRSLGRIRPLPRSGSHHRVASAGGSRSHRRRSGWSARFFLARHRAGDARLGGSARWRRLECECSGSRQDHASEGAVQLTRRRNHADRAALCRLRLERTTGIALLNEYDDNRHWRRTFVIDVDDPQPKPRLLWDLSTDEKYANPGNPVKRQLANGSWVVRQDGDSIYLAGVGSSPDGDRPFLDRLDLKSKR